ncbi:MAG: outer membrane beta-barrel protein [Cyanobacteria bacterium J06643_4]
MSINKGLLTIAGLSVLALGTQLPARAQDQLIAQDFAAENLAADLIAVDSTSVEEISVEEIIAADAIIEDTQLAAPTPALTLEEESTELAQARRRTRGSARTQSFIGVGADFGTADDVSFAVISKFGLNEQLALRPSVLIGDDFAVLVPLTYEFQSTSLDGFQISPYAGVGASYVEDNNNNNNNSEFGLLLSAGVDVPISRRFTINGQLNYAGIFSDSSNFGGTVGVGYNF